MAATRSGGIKAAHTNKKLYGDDFYVKIGAIGGEKSRGGGFTKKTRLAQIAGKVGGMGGWNNIPKVQQMKLRAEINKIKGYKDDYR